MYSRIEAGYQNFNEEEDKGLVMNHTSWSLPKSLKNYNFQLSAKGLCLFMCLFFTAYLGAQTITISEIMYSSNSTRDGGDWIELHNYGSSDIDVSKWSFTDGSHKDTPFVFPASASLKAGGYLLLVQNLTKFSKEYPGISNKLGSFGFGLSKNGDTLQIKDNNGTEVLKMYYSSGKNWPKGASSKGGRSLELRNAASNSNLNNASAWFDGCMGGSPGAAYTHCGDRIDFSEINYNSDSVYDQSEYLELHNTTSSDINIAGYSIRDGKDTITHQYFFPSGTTIAAKGYLIVTNSVDSFKKRNPNINNFIGPFGFNLSNGSDYLRLYNVSGKIIFSVYYQDSLPWPVKADGHGNTLELLSDTGKMDDGDNWRAGCYGGSPGTAFDPSCITGIEKMEQMAALKIFPNPFTDNITIENPGSGNFKINLFDMTGRLMKEVISSDAMISVGTQDIPAGIYMLKAGDAKNQYSSKVLKF